MDYKEKHRLKMEDPDCKYHGTPTGYIYGCRCAKCTDAIYQYKAKPKRFNAMLKQREKNKNKLLSDPDNKLHGTPTGYTYGCRCERCKIARSEYAKKYREKKKGEE